MFIKRFKNYINNLVEIKCNDYKLRIEKLEARFNDLEPLLEDKKFIIKTSNKIIAADKGVNLLKKVLKHLGHKKIYEAKLSYRSHKSIPMPLIVLKNDNCKGLNKKFKDIIHDSGTPMFSSINDEYYVYSNTSTKVKMSIIEDIHFEFDIDYEVLKYQVIEKIKQR